MSVGHDAATAITHADVLTAAEHLKPRLTAVVRGVLASLANG
jgi:hypothetical protein